MPEPQLFHDADGRFRVRLRFGSDWHIGAGIGRPGDVDRLVRRDDDGFPFVPAKTLTGVWRDACEQVATGLDHGRADTCWQDLVHLLFGPEPGRGDRQTASALLSVRPARLGDRLRRALTTHPRTAEALTFVKPGVRIDHATGRAIDRHLRFEEQARAGTLLVADARLAPDLDEEVVHAAAALLVAGAALLDRLGGKRRRGGGRCHLTIEGAAGVEEWFDVLRGNPPLLPNAPSVIPTAAPTDPSAIAAEAAPGWQEYALTATAITPIVAPDRSRGNVTPSLDAIPGTLLLAALASHWRSLGVDLAAPLRARELIVTDLVPSPDGTTARPAPLSLARPKRTTDSRAYNRLVEEPPTGLQVKPVRRGVVTDRAPTRPVGPARVAATHATIDDAQQRPTAEVGGVYTYEALPAATTFTGHIRIRGGLAAALDGANWLASLPEAVAVGRSKKDDYGLLALRVAATEDRPERADLRAGDSIIVWLQSDAVLVDDRLRPDATLEGLRRCLADALGCDLETADPAQGRVTAALEATRRESWQASWGLPRSGLVGLKAGSVATFTLSADLPADRITEVEVTGIGVRTAEGFGQVLVDHPSLTMRPGEQPTVDAEVVSSPVLLDGDDDPEDVRAARIVESAAWRAAIRRASMSIAADAEGRWKVLGWPPSRDGRTSPPPSQLGALRTVLASLDDTDGRDRARAWFAHLRTVRNRSDKWPPGSLDLLEGLLGDEARIWEVLGLPEVELVLTEDGVQVQRQERWAEAVRTLVTTAIHVHTRTGGDPQEEEH